MTVSFTHLTVILSGAAVPRLEDVAAVVGVLLWSCWNWRVCWDDVGV